MKKIILLSFFLFSSVIGVSVLAQTLDIGDDLSLTYWESYTINSTYTCNTGTVIFKIERFQNSIRQYEWTWYTFSPTSPFQLKSLLTCFPSWNTGLDIINVTIKDPLIVAGDNVAYTAWTIVNLSWNVSRTSCTSFDYQWEQISGPIVEIINSWQMMVNSNIYDSASFIFPDTTEDIVMKLNVTPQSCYHSLHTYSGMVVYSKYSWGGGWGGWWGISYNSIMQDEAKKLFADTGSIDKIDLHLRLNRNVYSPTINLSRDNIGWDGQIYYTLEYSTGSNFRNFQKFETTSREYSLLGTVLDTTSWVHYFRVNAWYLGESSNYSNIVTYYTEDYLNIDCKKNCKNIVSFDDILLDIDVLLEWMLNVSCSVCKRISK